MSLGRMRTDLNDLLKRVLFAVPAAIVFIWLTWMGGWYFKGMIILIVFFIQQEVIRLLEGSGNPSDMFFPYTIGLWILLSPEISYVFEIGLGIMLIFTAIQTFDQTEESITKLATTFFAGIYAPLGFLCLILIRNFGTPAEGFLLTMAVMLMVWGSDVFAYFGGKTFGKRKLAPAISPNKTWEGFLSGYLGCFVGLALALYLIPIESPVSLTYALPVVLLVATFGPIGDLIESKMKRKAMVKDSSNLLPGHGGFFDRFDAVILVAPVAYIYFKLLQDFGYVSL